MKPTLTIGNAVVYHGNNLDVLPTLPDNSVDSIVCDPPYELGFMGKKWDSSGIAYSVELWTECMRVLKPGGHLLAFSGSRTYHRMVVAIEDAGFEIRDMIAWISNKTFPKSMDIAKAIDKSDATEARRKRDLVFTAWMRLSDLSQSKCAHLLLPFAKNKESAAAMAQHYYTDKTQPAVPTAELFDRLRPYLPEVPDYIERLVAERTVESENFKKREVIGERRQRGTQGGVIAFNTADSETEIITAPATDEAKQWAGWGTALKPTVEPIVMARKPLIGTVAENVLTWGVGGLNIDGSRIKANGDNLNGGKLGGKNNEIYSKGLGDTSGQSMALDGRWPANIILDEYTAGLLDEQSGNVRSNGNHNNNKSGLGNAFVGGKVVNPVSSSMYNDKGGASRFFYVAKASKKDRGENNTHPTVKPSLLMEYLIKLVTPPNGTVLDPFTGSGSTGKAALLNGFKFIGIELSEEYLPIIEGRLTHASQAKEEEESETLF